MIKLDDFELHKGLYEVVVKFLGNDAWLDLDSITFEADYDSYITPSFSMYQVKGRFGKKTESDEEPNDHEFELLLDRNQSIEEIKGFFYHELVGMDL